MPLDIQNKVFGDLTVIEKTDERKNGSVIWICKCKCGNHTRTPTPYLTSGSTKSCGCRRNYIGKNNPNFKHGFASGNKTTEYNMFHSAKKRSIKQNIPFEITIEDIIIPEYCPVFKNIKLKRNKKTSNLNSPTLDRLIPELGYIKSNIRVISGKANVLKNNASLEELEKIIIWMKAELQCP